MNIRPRGRRRHVVSGNRRRAEARRRPLPRRRPERAIRTDVRRSIAPHAGLMFSGPVGAHAYKAASGGTYDVAVLVGPSHFVAFDGVALYPEGAFETPLGPIADRPRGRRARWRPPRSFTSLPSAHRREHSLEMQLPFLRHVLPDVPIVPLLMGYQMRETITALAAALAAAFAGRRVAARREHRSVALLRRRDRSDARRPGPGGGRGVRSRGAARRCSRSIRSTSADATSRAAADRRSR